MPRLQKSEVSTPEQTREKVLAVHSAKDSADMQIGARRVGACAACRLRAAYDRIRRSSDDASQYSVRYEPMVKLRQRRGARSSRSRELRVSVEEGAIRRE